MTQNKKKITKNEKPLGRVSPVQYSQRRQSRWVLADYGGKDLWKKVTFEPVKSLTIAKHNNCAKIKD